VAGTFARTYASIRTADDPVIFIARREEASVRAEAIALEASTKTCRTSA
jgi:hypothetical protein